MLHLSFGKICTFSKFSKWPPFQNGRRSKRGTQKFLNVNISKTVEQNFTKLCGFIEGHRYYQFMKKKVERLETFGGHFENCKNGLIEKVNKTHFLLSAQIRKDDLMDQNQILQDDRTMFAEASFTFEILKMAAISKWPPFKVRYPDLPTFTNFDENWYTGYLGDGEQDGGTHFSKFQNGRPRWPPILSNFSTLTDFNEN